MNTKKAIGNLEDMKKRATKKRGKK